MELKFLWLKFAILDISVQQPMVGHVLKQRKWINCVIKEIKCCSAKARWRLGSVCSLVNCFLLSERVTDWLQYPSCPKGGKSDLFLKDFTGEQKLDIFIVHHWISNVSLAGMASFRFFYFFRWYILLQKNNKLESFLFGSQMKALWHGIQRGGVKCSLCYVETGAWTFQLKNNWK